MSTPMVRLATMLGLIQTAKQVPHHNVRSGLTDPENWQKLVDAFSGLGHTNSALKLSAVFAANDRISKDLAILPFRPVKTTDRGQQIARDHDQWFITRAFNPKFTPYVFKYTLNTHVNLLGNGFSPITRKNGRPVSYDIWHPRDVSLQIVNDRIYWVNTKTKDVVSDNDMIHLMWYTENGLIGKSVLTFAADTIEMGMAASKMATSMYTNGMFSPGYIKYKTKIESIEQAQLISSTFSGNYMGEANQLEIPVLDQDSSFEQWGMSMRDAQFIDNRNFTVKDIARFFGLQDSKLNIKDGNVSYNSLEQENVAYTQDTLLPRCVMWEEEFDRKALMEDDADDVQFKNELKMRLRGDTASRSTFYDMGLRNGVFSINDVRALEDMDTIGPEGDTRYINGAMKTLDQINNPPEAEQAKAVKALMDDINKNGNGHAKEILHN